MPRSKLSSVWEVLLQAGPVCSQRKQEESFRRPSKDPEEGPRPGAEARTPEERIRGGLPREAALAVGIWLSREADLLIWNVFKIKICTVLASV